MSAQLTELNMVINHCKLLLRADSTHSFPKIIKEVITMLDSLGHHIPEDFDSHVIYVALDKYRDFLINNKAA